MLGAANLRLRANFKHYAQAQGVGLRGNNDGSR